MKIFADNGIKGLFFYVAAAISGFSLIAELFCWLSFHRLSLGLILLFALLLICVLLLCYRFFAQRNQILEAAVWIINSYLDGDTDARIDCDEEGELYRLFHCVNTLAAVLNAHAANELREKAFLKDTISDISHQLKTPLATLNIYIGLMQQETGASPEMQEFAALSEQELDRMDTLVQNLLKITKLDTGSIVFEKRGENLADMLKDVQLHFAYRAKQEQKTILLSGSDSVFLFCDRDWMLEALDNIVKNALDHTKPGNSVWISWRQFPSIVQLTIKDDGSGIHSEDLPYIFKRFYRSRFSKDTQGLGLGLPLAKGIIEAHSGTIEVQSELGIGTTFVVNFINSDKTVV